MKRTILLLTPLLFSAGCSLTSPSDPKEDVGPVIAHYTLTAVDGNPPPCCASDSAGVRITVVGGALTFHGPAGYRDTVFTPAGPRSRACVHGVPNGAFVNSRTYTVTLTDGTRYLLLPCDRGAYDFIVIRRLDHEIRPLREGHAILFELVLERSPMHNPAKALQSSEGGSHEEGHAL